MIQDGVSITTPVVDRAQDRWDDEWFLNVYVDAEGDYQVQAEHTEEILADGVVIRGVMRESDGPEDAVEVTRHIIRTRDYVENLTGSGGPAVRDDQSPGSEPRLTDSEFAEVCRMVSESRPAILDYPDNKKGVDALDRVSEGYGFDSFYAAAASGGWPDHPSHDGERDPGAPDDFPLDERGLYALCALAMAADPCPLDETDEAAAKAALDALASAFGFEGWVEAYHGLRRRTGAFEDERSLRDGREYDYEVSAESPRGRDEQSLRDRVEDVEDALEAMGRSEPTSDGRPPVDAPERLDEIEEAARAARADTKDAETARTLVSRVEDLEAAVDRLGREVR